MRRLHLTAAALIAILLIAPAAGQAKPDPGPSALKAASKVCIAEQEVRSSGFATKYGSGPMARCKTKLAPKIARATTACKAMRTRIGATTFRSRFGGTDLGSPLGVCVASKALPLAGDGCASWDDDSLDEAGDDGEAGDSSDDTDEGAADLSDDGLLARRRQPAHVMVGSAIVNAMVVTLLVRCDDSASDEDDLGDDGGLGDDLTVSRNASAAS